MIRTKLKITDRDAGLKRLLRDTLIPGKTNVTVGVQADVGSQQHVNSKLTVLDIATIHEFGLGNNPERSFIRATFDANQEQNLELIYRLAQLVLDGKLTRDEALNQLGLRFQAQVIDRINSNIPPPLSPATVKRKGSSLALVDTGQLKSSITYKIERDEVT